jgi:hypothetical protein
MFILLSPGNTGRYEKIGNTARENTPVRIQNGISRKELEQQCCFFYFYCVGTLWKMEEVCRPTPDRHNFGLILNTVSFKNIHMQSWSFQLCRLTTQK